MDNKIFNYELVIFDVDGTILDTSEGMFSSLRFAMQQNGIEVLTEDKLKTFIGPPVEFSLKRYYSLSAEEMTVVAKCYRERYREIDIFKAEPYAGIEEVFDQLAKNGCKLAVATFKRQCDAEKIIKKFGFDQWLQIICGSDNEGKYQKKDIIANAVKAAAISDLHKAVMIGDSMLDMERAKSVGIDFIGATYGYGFHSSSEINVGNVVGVAKSAKDILQI